MNILVTGGGGFLGRYIVEDLLAKGHSVSSFARSPQLELEAKGVKVVQGDLQNTKADLAQFEMRKADYAVKKKLDDVDQAGRIRGGL